MLCRVRYQRISNLKSLWESFPTSDTSFHVKLVWHKYFEFIGDDTINKKLFVNNWQIQNMWQCHNKIMKLIRGSVTHSSHLLDKLSVLRCSYSIVRFCYCFDETVHSGAHWMLGVFL